jgi:membrane peptidoglycan carboxypeptidase
VGDPANSAIKNAKGGDIFGRGLPGAIWQRFMNSYLMGTPLETFPPFTLIGPAAPPVEDHAPSVEDQPPTSPTHTREPRSATQSVTPEPGIEDFGSPPSQHSVKPAKPAKPTKPQRDACFPFCDEQAPGDEGQSNQGG